MRRLTSVDQATVHDQVVDVALDLNEVLILSCLLFLASLNQSFDVPWEEIRLDSVDDVEQELSVEGLVSLQIRQIFAQFPIFE